MKFARIKRLVGKAKEIAGTIAPALKTHEAAFALGVSSIVLGVGSLSVPAGMIVGGVLVVALTILHKLGERR